MMAQRRFEFRGPKSRGIVLDQQSGHRGIEFDPLDSVDCLGVADLLQQMLVKSAFEFEPGLDLSQRDSIVHRIPRSGGHHEHRILFSYESQPVAAAHFGSKDRSKSPASKLIVPEAVGVIARVTEEMVSLLRFADSRRWKQRGESASFRQRAGFFGSLGIHREGARQRSRR